MTHSPDDNKPGQRVAVAMSGGVDSSVAAALLVEQGYDVVGLMMRLWSEPIATDSIVAANRCCTPDQMADARRVADQLGIPFYVLDAQQQFRASVVQHYIDEHEAGRTPNPCIACNRQIRFTFLLQHALALGAQYLATGHYARVRQLNGHYQLLRGVDPKKDQSYVLHVLDQEKLAQVMFPVGEFTKGEVRELAHDFKLPVAAKHESQDLCFVIDGDHNSFLRRHGGGMLGPGLIVDTSGRELGHHEGLPFYTIGQRKGLGISAEQPLYVAEKDVQRNALVVAPRSVLECTEFFVRDVNWLSGTPPADRQPLQVKIRYKAQAVAGKVSRSHSRQVRVTLESPVVGVTPGQGAVFYDDEVCLGGGIIADHSIAAGGHTETHYEE